MALATLLLLATCQLALAHLHLTPLDLGPALRVERGLGETLFNSSFYIPGVGDIMQPEPLSRSERESSSGPAAAPRARREYEVALGVHLPIVGQVAGIKFSNKKKPKKKPKKKAQEEKQVSPPQEELREEPGELTTPDPGTMIDYIWKLVG